MERIIDVLYDHVLGKPFWWIAMIVSALLFTFCDSMAKVWFEAEKPNKFYFLIPLFVAAPIAYMLFGVVAGRAGLAIASGIVNSLLVLGTMLVGLFLMNEWGKVTVLQLVGMALSLVGIVLMLLFTKAE